MSETLPLPPLEMRELVGSTDADRFDNPLGGLVFPDIPVEHYESVFDFGCGCGRLARQFIQQNPRPGRYVGIDLHKGMILWCQKNLSPAAPGFLFYHHDIHNPGFNPTGTHKTLTFPVEDGSFKLIVAWSVFTHLLEEQVVPYLSEVKRILAPQGIFLSTWFTFDKTEYPMMQSFQNALYINPVDPTNAVIFDRSRLKSVIADLGLSITKIVPPRMKGFQWRLHMVHTGQEGESLDFPPDLAPIGIERPPVPQKDSSQIGLDPDESDRIVD